MSSFATLPLFATEASSASRCTTNPTGSKNDAHLVVAGGIGGLFAVNTFTGVWNLLEARKDPHFGKRKWPHAPADARRRRRLRHDGGARAEQRAGESAGTGGAHRAAAFTSIGLATTGYLIMLFGDH